MRLGTTRVKHGRALDCRYHHRTDRVVTNWVICARVRNIDHVSSVRRCRFPSGTLGTLGAPLTAQSLAGPWSTSTAANQHHSHSPEFSPSLLSSWWGWGRAPSSSTRRRCCRSGPGPSSTPGPCPSSSWSSSSTPLAASPDCPGSVPGRTDFGTSLKQLLGQPMIRFHPPYFLRSLCQVLFCKVEIKCGIINGDFKFNHE